MMRREEGCFGAADRRRVFHQRWLPDGAARAAVVIIHGYAEHSGRYDWTGERLAESGYAAYALDLVGHGQSDGKRALVRSMNEFLVDVRAFVALVRGREPGKPLFLLGHSMGGGITALYLGVDAPDVRGAVLSGAVLATGGRGSAIIERLARVIGRLFPRLPIAKLKSSSVSRDRAVVQAYDNDPLVYRGRMKAGMLAAMARGMQRADEAAPGITTPLFILHGGDDELTSPNGSRRLYDRVASTDRTLKIYDGLFHEILNEPEREVVLSDVVAWLDARS